ncbi:hypothetical protein SALBM311S_04557 [Streptomyces alboniger]
MLITGEFTVSGSGAALAALAARTEELSSVTALTEVTVGQDGAVNALFSPLTPFGRIPLRTRIRAEQANSEGALLAVHAVRAQHAVDVRIHLTFSAEESGSRVTWSADLAVRGPAASVSQRVARQVAARAIGEVLESAAALA